MSSKNKITNITAKQLSNSKMLITTEIDGIIIHQQQDIKDVDTDKLDRKAKILKANEKTVKPVIGDKKIKIDKSADISGFLGKVMGTGQGGKV